MATANKHEHRTRVLWISFLFLTFMTVFSCTKDATSPDFNSDDTSSAGSDAVEDSYLDESDDLSSQALAKNDAEGGKVYDDDRLSCAVITHTGTKESGTLRIDFGTGCTDLRGNVRRGAIVVTHNGRWNDAGTIWQVTYDAYFVNNIGIDGNRQVTVVSATDSLVTYDVVLTNGKLTWPDGSIGTREVNHRREHEIHDDHLLDRLIIYGTATGTTHRGRAYHIEILERLIYRRACLAEGVVIPVSGLKLITHGERELKVDYGDGTCDNIVTLINKNGRSTQYEVKP